MEMLFKIGEIRPYAIGKVIYYGKILEVNKQDKTYLLENLETKEQVIISENFVFIGDD